MSFFLNVNFIVGQNEVNLCFGAFGDDDIASNKCSHNI